MSLLFSANLTNKGSQATAKDFSLAVFGDPHADSTYYSGTLKYRFRDGLSYIKNHFPETVDFLSVGDFIDRKADDMSDESFLHTALGYMDKGDRYTVLGNHDVEVGVEHSQIATFFNEYSEFKDVGDMYTKGYCHDIKDNLHIFLLNSIEAGYTGISGDAGVKGIGLLSETQYNWFLSELNSITERNQRIIVVLHMALMTDGYRWGATSGTNIMEKIQADKIVDALTTWQAKSDHGLVVASLSGHTHIDGKWIHEKYEGKLNNITFDEAGDEPPTRTSYPGDATTIVTDLEWMAFGILKWNEATKVLTIDGYGQQVSYSYDFSDRVTFPDLEYEKPTTVTNLQYSNYTGTSVQLTWDASTDEIGVVNYSIYDRGILKVTVSGTSYTLGGLSSSLNKYITIKANTARGQQSIHSNHIHLSPI